MTPEVVIRKSSNDKFIVSTKRGEFVLDDLEAVLRHVCNVFRVDSLHFIGDDAFILREVAKRLRDRFGKP